MATPTPTPTSTPPLPLPLPPSERLALEQKARYDRLTRNLAIGGLITCPVIALLPPRKLDLYTFSLAIGFYLSADHLAQSSTGRPLLQQFSFTNPVTTLPTERAERNRELLKEAERVRREGLGELKDKERERGVLERVWMGGESEGWKERRLEEERKALEEGKSFADMIFEQIWHVWNWGDDKENKKE
ncbi:unnamed protein product [Periconia digitata]|uniref:Uncharacterized protein n=1 Tax=Periconia digitata TaxID=1303443 RepID=A0A9W4UCD6_9PLEO|nr:unnamed protein product [Periconia digitata]